MSSILKTEGMKCHPCVKAIVINTAKQICEQNKSDNKQCNILEQQLKQKNITILKYLDETKKLCETETCKIELEELKKFYEGET